MKYLDLSELHTTNLKHCIKNSKTLSKKEIASVHMARSIEPKALILDEIEKAYKVCIHYLGYNKNREVNRYTIVAWLPKYFVFTDKNGNKYKKVLKVIEE